MTSIVFDLDGTLIDSAPDIQAGVNAMLDDHGIAPLSLEKITSFIGNGLPHLVRLVIDETGMNPGDHALLTAQTLAHYDRVNGSLSRLYPGVTDCLSALRSGGARVGVCTNKPKAPALDVLAHFGIDGLFDVVIGGDSLPQRKPDPAPLQASFAALGGTTLYVGDSEVDYATAMAADAPFALFTGGYRKSPLDAFPAARPFDSFHELPGLIAAL